MQGENSVAPIFALFLGASVYPAAAIAQSNSRVFHALPQLRPLCFDSSRFHACDTELKSSRRNNIPVTTNSNRDSCLLKGQPPSLSYSQHSRRLSAPSHTRLDVVGDGPPGVTARLRNPCQPKLTVSLVSPDKRKCLAEGLGCKHRCRVACCFSASEGAATGRRHIDETDTPPLQTWASRLQPNSQVG